MNNCEDHNKLPDLNGVTIVLLPANKTAVYQQLDQGLISMTNIQYRSLQLRETINILLRMQESGNNFKSTTENGIYGIKEGQMPHVKDAINFMDTACAKVPVSAIVRCWLKSKCLALAHEHKLRELLPANTSFVLIEEQPIDTEEARQLLCEHSLLNLSPIPDSPLVDLLNDVNEYDSSSSMHTIVNTQAPDEGRLQDVFAASEIQDLFDTQDGTEEHSSINKIEDQSVTAMRAMQMLTNVATTSL